VKSVQQADGPLQAIQNRVSDFSGLVEYLRIDPFSTAKVFDDEIVQTLVKVCRQKRCTNEKIGQLHLAMQNKNGH
jgi:hypothetical protein